MGDIKITLCYLYDIGLALKSFDNNLTFSLITHRKTNLSTFFFVHVLFIYLWYFFTNFGFWSFLWLRRKWWSQANRYLKKGKRKSYHILKKKKIVIYRGVQGRQQKFILNVETVHVKRLQACFKQLEYRKENIISTDTFTLRIPTAILTFFRLGFHTLPHISQL